MQYNIHDINQAVFDEMRVVMKKKFSLVLNEYLQDSQKYIWNIQEGIQIKNMSRVIASAHPLKSSSMALGFNGLGNLAKDIELISRAASESGVNNGGRLMETASFLDEAYTVVKNYIKQPQFIPMVFE